MYPARVQEIKYVYNSAKLHLNKKKMFGKLSDNTLEDARFQESRKHRAEVSASTSFPLLCFQHRPDTEIQPRDLRVNQYALYYVPQILIFFKYYWQHCFYYFNHLRSHVGLYHKAIFHFCCQQWNLVSCHSELVPHYLPSLPVMWPNLGERKEFLILNYSSLGEALSQTLEVSDSPNLTMCRSISGPWNE